MASLGSSDEFQIKCPPARQPSANTCDAGLPDGSPHALINRDPDDAAWWRRWRSGEDIAVKIPQETGNGNCRRAVTPRILSVARFAVPWPAFQRGKKTLIPCDYRRFELTATVAR